MSPELISFFAWYLAAAVAGVVALPLAFRLFRHLPDRGYTFAKPLGLLTTGFVFWLLGSLGFLRNDAPGVIFAALIVGAGGLIWLGRPGLRALREWLVEQRALLLLVEVLFLAAFALMVFVRSKNPEILGTEKPMEFMFINSILRSATFPPQDAWLAGHAISYYYFGYVIVAALARVTGTTASVAFNLGLALLFALTAAGAHGVVLNLTALQGTRTPKSERDTGWGSLVRYAWPALFGPFMVLIAGNFYGLAQLAYTNGLFGNTNIWAVRYYYGTADPTNGAATGGASSSAGTQAASAPAADPGIRLRPINFWAWLDLKQAGPPAPAPPAAFNWNAGGNWFFAARVLHDRDLLGKESEAIDEMPSFSFLLGDMHPHVLALPFVVLATGLALEWLLWGMTRWRVGTEVGGRRSEVGGGRSKIGGGRREGNSGGAPVAVVGDEEEVDDPEGEGEASRAVGGGNTGADEEPFELSLAVLRRPSFVVRLLVSAIILGGLSFLNTWDFPIYLFLTLVAFALGLGLRWGWKALAAAWWRLGVLAIGLAVISVLLYFPFYLTFQSQAGGILPNIIWPTRFQQSLVFFGPVLIGAAIYLTWLTGRGWRWLDRRAALGAGLGIVFMLALVVVAITLGASLSPSLSAFVNSTIAPLSLSQALGLAAQRRVVDSLATVFPAVIIGLCAGLAVGVLRRAPASVASESSPASAAEKSDTRRKSWRRSRPESAGAFLGEGRRATDLATPAVMMALAMLLTGALLMLGPEWVYLRDNFGWRMNTLFKFYFQTWTLWALAGAFGLWHLTQAARRATRWTACGLMGLAALGGLVYTGTSLYSKTNGLANVPTLDGMAWYAHTYPDDWAAINWLKQNVSGSPVIAEAVGGAYNIEESRIAMATGLPAVMGWTNHEGQWRGAYYAQVAERPGQIQTLYQVRDWKTAQTILDQYHIEYLIVGAEERTKYNPLYLPKFDQNMDIVFKSGNLIIYRRKPQSAQ